VSLSTSKILATRSGSSVIGTCPQPASATNRALGATAGSFIGEGFPWPGGIERVRWSAKSTATRIFLTVLKPTEGAASVAGLDVTRISLPPTFAYRVIWG
jgi:hypothetical protein